MHIRVMHPHGLAVVAQLIAALQDDPQHHIGYLDREPAAIAAQRCELQPLGLDGVLVADEDHWNAVAGALYAAVVDLLPDHVRGQELFHDARSTRLARFATRHGFRREPARRCCRVPSMTRRSSRPSTRPPSPGRASRGRSLRP